MAAARYATAYNTYASQMGEKDTSNLQRYQKYFQKKLLDSEESDVIVNAANSLIPVPGALRDIYKFATQPRRRTPAAEDPTGLRGVAKKIRSGAAQVVAKTDQVAAQAGGRATQVAGKVSNATKTAATRPLTSTFAERGTGSAANIRAANNQAMIRAIDKSRQADLRAKSKSLRAAQAQQAADEASPFKGLSPETYQARQGVRAGTEVKLAPSRTQEALSRAGTNRLTTKSAIVNRDLAQTLNKVEGSVRRSGTAEEFLLSQLNKDGRPKKPSEVKNTTAEVRVKKSLFDGPDSELPDPKPGSFQSGKGKNLFDEQAETLAAKPQPIQTRLPPPPSTNVGMAERVQQNVNTFSRVAADAAKTTAQTAADAASAATSTAAESAAGAAEGVAAAAEGSGIASLAGPASILGLAGVGVYELIKNLTEKKPQDTGARSRDESNTPMVRASMDSESQQTGGSGGF